MRRKKVFKKGIKLFFSGCVVMQVLIAISVVTAVSVSAARTDEDLTFPDLSRCVVREHGDR